ncbi:MAG TPA: hypothetical protein DCZ20_03940 [Lachnospiraceae bacterium]|nr:hypothetical protein [Lachnospiraceae bacterium]
MKRQWVSWMIAAAVIALLLSGCGKKETEEVTGSCIYYVNETKDGLVKVAYEKSFSDAGKEAEDILKKMKQTPESLEYHAAIPKEIEIRGISGLSEQRKVLILDFSSNYHDLDPVTEVLLREAVVCTMVQIDGVDAVAFTVDKVPLQDKYGNAVGEMSEESFLKETGSAVHSYKQMTLTLYFGNEEGDRLKTEEVTTRYNGNMQIEKLVLEQLQKGPTENGLTATFPKNIMILSVSLKDGICYLNLDEQFLTAEYLVQPEIVIQSIVNSVIDAGNVSQVQISVNGETDKTFQGVIPLNRPFSRNLDIVEQ